MSKLGNLLDQMVAIKVQGNKAGFVDQELGKLEIVVVEGGMQIKKDVKIEFVKVQGSGFAVLMELSEPKSGGLIAI